MHLILAVKIQCENENVKHVISRVQCGVLPKSLWCCSQGDEEEDEEDDDDLGGGTKRAADDDDDEDDEVGGVHQAWAEGIHVLKHGLTWAVDINTCVHVFVILPH